MEELYKPKRETSELELKIFGETPINTETDRRMYYKLKLERIKSGDPTFMVRNFDCNVGFAFDYFADKKHVGYVHLDEDGLCDVCINGVNDYINPKPVTLEEAIELIENPVI